MIWTPNSYLNNELHLASNDDAEKADIDGGAQYARRTGLTVYSISSNSLINDDEATQMTEHRKYLRDLSANRPFLLGAAIGTGMSAKAAARGGADFLLALSAGRFRSMGAPSAACMLAMRDSNRLVMEFGRTEVLTRTSLPVYFGATALGTDDMTSLVSRIADCGFRGVTNFPSCTFLDGRYRKYLDRSGLGFENELKLLRTARAHGLLTIAYVHNVREAHRAASSGVDMVNLNFGWNVGGLVGVDNSVELDDATKLARRFVITVRSVRSTTKCLIEGGPIVVPDQMDHVCRLSGADGYIGGSTIDRVPLESALETTTNSFKTIGGLRRQIEALDKLVHRKIGVEALIGFNDTIERAREETARAVGNRLPVLIVGEVGSGTTTIARIIHKARSRPGTPLITVDCKVTQTVELRALLFGDTATDSSDIDMTQTGVLNRSRGADLLLVNVDELDVSLQKQLLQFCQAEVSSDGKKGICSKPSLIGISHVDSEGALQRKRPGTKFLRWLQTVHIALPALRERLEDLPMIAEAILRDASYVERRRLDPTAYRALLGYHWPGNVEELRAVIQAAAKTGKGLITEAHLIPLMKSRQNAPSDRSHFVSESEWILDGLRRNRFRRAETAQFLRISRKTLYNKIRRYRLSDRPIADPDPANRTTRLGRT